jgi:hypothetical protein
MGDEVVTMRRCGVTEDLRFLNSYVFVILVTRQRNCRSVSTENTVMYWFVPLFDKRLVRQLRGKEASLSQPDLLRRSRTHTPLDSLTLYHSCSLPIIIKVNVCLSCVVLRRCQIKSNEIKKVLVK